MLQNNQPEKKFAELLKHIEPLSQPENTGVWKMLEGSIMPYVSWGKVVQDFIRDVYKIVNKYPEYDFTNYRTALEDKGLYKKLAAKKSMFS